MTTATSLRAAFLGAAIGALCFAGSASAQSTLAQTKPAPPASALPTDLSKLAHPTSAIPGTNGYVRNPLPNDPRLKTDSFDFAYVEPKDSKHKDLYDKLRHIRLLEKLQAFLAPIKLPRRVMIKVEGCNGLANAYFDNDEIKVCYEYFEYLMKKSPKMVRQGLSPRDALIGPTIEVFLHELGHGLIRILDVPYFGKEEDVADYIATYLLLTFCQDDARRLILGASFIGDAEAMEEQGKAPELRTIADSHSLPAQRYYNRWCMAYGANQEIFGDAIEIGMLPPNRVKWCKYEWQSNEYAFQQLIEPYIDQDMKKVVKSKHWFMFETPVAATFNKPQIAKSPDTQPQPAGAARSPDAAGAPQGAAR
jgi:hypothetical protein